MNHTDTDTDITRGTTNVFADLNLPDAAERQTKTRLALVVNELLTARKLKQREIAEVAAGSPSPRSPHSSTTASISSRWNCLMEFLNALDRDVDITIRPRDAASQSAHVSVLLVQ